MERSLVPFWSEAAERRSGESIVADRTSIITISRAAKLITNEIAKMEAEDFSFFMSSLPIGFVIAKYERKKGLLYNKKEKAKIFLPSLTFIVLLSR